MYPDAYIEYLFHFHSDRDLFECHEVLEEYWKEHPDDPKGNTWVGLIQVAVALYHQRRGNRAGAVKMMATSLRNMNVEHLAELGIDAPVFRRDVERRLELLEDETLPFADFDIPLADGALIHACMQLCEQRGIRWKQPSDLNDRFLMNKHTLRDRSDVIEARTRQLTRRRTAK